jgi:2-polyprenyl-6-methoxyphenol hydroxylase-like FAD-dependent oxidoreductase
MAPSFWEMSPTNVLHLAQNRFEDILLTRHHQHSESAQNLITSYFGYSGELVDRHLDGSKIRLVPAPSQPSRSKEVPQEIECDYLVSCEGTTSSVRNQLGIKYEGKEKLQHLMNIHFKCHGLSSHLKANDSKFSTINTDRKPPAMLHFIFNEVSNFFTPSLTIW